MMEFDESEAGSSASVRRVGAMLAGVVAAAVVVFSLGVMVGKRVTGNVPAVVEPPQALPTETLVPAPYSRSEKVEERKRETDPGKKASVDESLSSEKLTFFNTLPGEKKAEPPPVVKKPVTEKKVEVPKEVPKAPPPPKTVKEPPPRVKSAGLSPSEQVRALTGSGQFFVQVSSTTNRSWADDLISRLRKKGLDARSTPVSLEGKRWYRIRVGSFPDRESAAKAQRILKKMDLDGMVVRGD